MATQAEPNSIPDLGRFRPFLRLLAAELLHRRFHRRVDPSDLVQDTLAAAHERFAQFRGQSDAELIAWLRAILSNRLLNAVRDQEAGRRDIRREVSLERDIDASFARVEAWLNEQTSPSDEAHRVERWLQVAAAFEQLPAMDRECIRLRYWEGLRVGEIARQLETTERGVAGRLSRGLKRLRELLGDST